MVIDVNSIRVGNILRHENRLCVVLKKMHTQPGKGGAYMQLEMKDVQDGTKIHARLRTSETVEKVTLEEVEYQFLYKDGSRLVLIDKESYEQVEIDQTLLNSEQLMFLQDGMDVKIEYYNGSPISVVLPETVVAEIAECEPVIKGQTVTSSYKPAILDNGARVMVPQFISVGDKVIVNTNTQEYLERAK